MLVDAMVAAVAVVVVATIVALVVLRPTGGAVRSRSIAISKTNGARISRVADVRCAVAASQMCQVVTATLLDGRDKGSKTTFDFLPTAGASRLAAGDRICVLRNPPAPKGTPAGQRLGKYSFADYDRRLPLVWLGAAVVVLLLATGRFHGLRALVGLVAS